MGLTRTERNVVARQTHEVRPAGARSEATSQIRCTTPAGRFAKRTCKNTERCQSGRMGLTRNQVYGLPVPWVRIPPSPPPSQAFNESPTGDFRMQFSFRGLRDPFVHLFGPPGACQARIGRLIGRSLCGRFGWSGIRWPGSRDDLLGRPSPLARHVCGRASQHIHVRR